MPLNTGPLLKIIALESEKGYADSAVIGGLDRFVRNWAGQAAETITDRKLLARFNKLHLSNANYATLTKERRKELVNGIIAFLIELRDTEKEGRQKATKSVEKT